jgi:hypothetical protein
VRLAEPIDSRIVLSPEPSRESRHGGEEETRRSAIDGRTTRHPGYAASQRIRKRIEEGFGWLKTIAGLRKTKYRGLEKVRWAFILTAAAYNLIRLPKLMAAA